MRGSSAIVLPPQVFDLLAYLIRNRERVVSKDELIATIWDGRIVSDSALTTCINAARLCHRGIAERATLHQDLGPPRRTVRGLRSGNWRRAYERWIGNYMLGLACLPAGRTKRAVDLRAHVQAHVCRRGSEAMGQMMSEEMRIELTRLRCLKVARAADGCDEFLPVKSRQQ
jgi:hypothetical protein